MKGHRAPVSVPWVHPGVWLVAVWLGVPEEQSHSQGGHDGLTSKIPLILGPETLQTCPVASWVEVWSNSSCSVFRPRLFLVFFSKLESGHSGETVTVQPKWLQNPEGHGAEGAGQDVGVTDRSLEH